MPYAQVLTTASVASATGGTFADTLVANTGDSTAVANYATGGARWLEAWANDSAHVAELEVIYTRPESTHDQQHGWRSSVQASAFNAVGHVGEVSLLAGKRTLNVFKSDQPQLLVSSTASDCVALSYLTEYDDLPGASAVFVSPGFIAQHHKSAVGIRVSAVASGTAGAYGAQRAFNADDDRLHANTWYAIVGLNVQLPVLTVSLIGPDFGGQRIGLPAGSIEIGSSAFYIEQSEKWNKALIPCFNSNNKANTLVQVVDTTASTSPQCDFQLVELDLPSTWNGVGGGVF
jgi:hypothetical protein